MESLPRLELQRIVTESPATTAVLAGLTVSVPTSPELQLSEFSRRSGSQYQTTIVADASEAYATEYVIRFQSQKCASNGGKAAFKILNLWHLRLSTGKML